MCELINKDCVWFNHVCEFYNSTTCNHYCIRFMEMFALCKLSNIPKKNWKPISLYAINEDKNAFNQLVNIKTNILNFVKGGGNLYLYSENTGNGKTSWAIRLALAYCSKIWSGNGFRRRVLFLSVPQFLFKHKETIAEFDRDFNELKSDINKCDLVIWDDIGVSPLTTYEHQILLSYVDSRILNGKSNIFTGNINEQELQKYLGLRLASRVWNTSTQIHFKEPDKRCVGGNLND